MAACLWGFSFHLSNGQSGLLENGGRLPDPVVFTKQTGAGMLYYGTQGYTVLMHHTDDYDSLWEHIHRYKTLRHSFVVRRHRFDVNFTGSSGTGYTKAQPGKTVYNYYKNSLRATGLREYGEVVLKNLYPGIDWMVETSGELVKHSFVVKAGSKPETIKMLYRFTEGIRLEEGRLVISTSVGELIENQPYAFQITNGDTTTIPCHFVLEKNGDGLQVGFRTADYDRSIPLIIDPVLVFSTYSGSQGDNFGFTATYDSKSNLYAGGIVDGGTGTNGGPFPVTTGAFQTVYSGGTGQAPANLPCDIGINKYDSAGTTLLYSTYLGGSRDEYPHSLVADPHDNLLIMGTTYSPDFPVDTGGYDVVFNGGTDLFTVKLSEDGSTMKGGTFIGGSSNDGLNTFNLRYNYADDFRGDIVCDSSGHIYVASTTNSGDFPVLNAFQGTLASRQDGCIFSLDSNLRKLRFSTFSGGNGDDAMYSIRLNGGNVYAGGGTGSNAMSFPLNGQLNSYQGGRADGYIVHLDTSGQLLSGTYAGTPAYDQIFFLDIDASGRVYAAGQTEGSFQRTTGTYGKDNSSQFILRYTPNLSGTNLSVTFGNRTFDPEISPSAFLVDKCDNIYFSGWGSPIDYDGLHSLTTQGLQVSPDAIQKTTDGKDFYLLVLSKDARKMLHATYYGGNRTDDHVDGGTSRFDKKGVVYQSVCASCPEPGSHYNDFPVTSSAPFRTNLSPRCSNASFKIDFQINFQVDASFDAVPDSGCQPLSVRFINTSKNARQFFWDFGDGSQVDTSKAPVHTFQNPGLYLVRLTSVDSFSCNLTAFDSAFIRVLESPLAKFEFSGDVCSREVSFKNLSENYTSPVWDFGDSTGSSTENEPVHFFAGDGQFKVLLKVTHPESGCTDTQTAVVPMFGDPANTIKVPNVFTPNSDRTNDCYTIGGIQPACDEAEIWIYNRWGILVFHGILPEDCWNGQLMNSGDELPDGTYYYLLTVRSKGESAQEKVKTEGVIRIIR